MTRTTRWCWRSSPADGAVVGDGLVGVEVVEAVLDEVGPLHAGEEEEVLLAGQLGLHGLEDGVGGGGFGGGELGRGLGGGRDGKQKWGEL